MNRCSFCKKEQEIRLSKGYCVSCYQYFILHKFILWEPSKYGELSRVQQKDSSQYNFVICHECGKAFAKLQQHIWYSHNMAKNEYCDKWGLDHKIRMTSDEYNNKMSKYAYKYNMDVQLKNTGKNTRFEKGHSNNYKRSYQTMNRLKNQFK